MDRSENTPTVVEVPVSFSGLTEFEASVLTGALEEFAMRWVEEAPTARALAQQVREQLPAEWVEG